MSTLADEMTMLTITNIYFYSLLPWSCPMLSIKRKSVSPVSLSANCIHQRFHSWKELRYRQLHVMLSRLHVACELCDRDVLGEEIFYRCRDG